MTTTTTMTETLTVPRTRATRRARRPKVNLAFVTVLVMTLITLFPVYWMLLTALLPMQAIFSRTPTLIPTGEVSFGSFQGLLEKTPIFSWILQSAIITIGTSLLSGFICLLAAYALSRFVVPGRKMTAVGFLVGRVLPGTLLALPLFILFQTVGLLNTQVAVILANVAVVTPLTTLILKGYFDGIPREIDDAAMVDGCSRWGVLWRMIFPLSIPGLVACVGLSATAAWTDLLFARTLLLTRENWTLPMGITSIIGAHEVDWNELMAAGLISVIPMLIIYWFLQPHLVSGMTAGGVKG